MYTTYKDTLKRIEQIVNLVRENKMEAHEAIIRIDEVINLKNVVE